MHAFLLLRAGDLELVNEAENTGLIGFERDFPQTLVPTADSFIIYLEINEKNHLGPADKPPTLLSDLGEFVRRGIPSRKDLSIYSRSQLRFSRISAWSCLPIG